MKKPTSFVTAFLVLFTTSSFSQQAEFPRGVFLFGRTNVDFVQMRDSLHLNWVQGSSGSKTVHTSIDSNTAGLKVIASRDSLDKVSTSQRMKYEAELTSPDQAHQGLWNYFGTKVTGTDLVSEGARKCIAGSDPPGYMVSNPQPNNDFHYGRTSYRATFRMKITKGSNPSDTVAMLTVFCNVHNAVIGQRVLFDSTFSLTNNYYVFEVPFSVQTSSSASTDTSRFLAGAAAVRTSNVDCNSIDIRVDWRGNVTAWLDNVIVDDDVAKTLFAGGYDATIQADVNDYLTNPTYNSANLVQRLYLKDEPDVPAFLPYNYVDTKLKNLFPIGSSRGRGTTANYWWGSSAQRFFQDGQPNEYFFDQYVVKTYIPSPSMTAAQASDVGVAAYMTDASYTSSLQGALDTLVLAIKSIAEPLKPNGTFWYIPQLLGEYQKSQGKYIRLRPPTGSELKSTINLAVAYGAKGIIPYPYGTDGMETSSDWIYPGLVSPSVSDGVYKDHSSQTMVWNGNTIFTGYKEKWDALSSVFNTLQQIEPTLVTLTWQGTKSWNNNATAGTWSGLVSNLTTSVAGETKYVETGLFTYNSDDYLFIVNRRTLSNEIRTDTLSLNTSLNKKVIDVYSASSSIVPPGGKMIVTLAPGEGRLYKVTLAPPLAPSLVSPSNAASNIPTATSLSWNTASTATTYHVQIGTDSSYSDTTLMLQDSSLTTTSRSIGLAPSTIYYWHMRAKNAAGWGSWSSSSSFNAKISLNNNTTWSGRIALPSAVTIISDSTLNISPGTKVMFGSNGYLTINGTLNALGTSSGRILFDGSARNQYYDGGLRLSGAGSASIAYADFKKAKDHINMVSTGKLVVNSCTFADFDSLGDFSTVYGYAIYIARQEGWTQAIDTVKLTNNTLTCLNHNGWGIQLFNVSPSLLSVIGNNIQQCYVGIWTYEIASGTIGSNTISNCSYGITAFAGSLLFSGLTMSGNDVGVYLSYYYGGTVDSCSISRSRSEAILCNAGVTPTLQRNYFGGTTPYGNTANGIVVIGFDAGYGNSWTGVKIYSNKFDTLAIGVLSGGNGKATIGQNSSGSGGNTFLSTCKTGVQIQATDQLVSLQHNELFQVGTVQQNPAIESIGPSTVQYNSIVGAIVVDDNVTLNKNDISGMISVNEAASGAGISNCNFQAGNYVSNASTNQIQAGYNYWQGVCSTNDISSYNVNYSPVLQNPVTGNGPYASGIGGPGCSTPDIVGEWKFQNTLVDTTGNNSPGTGTGITYVTGKVNQGLQLSGSKSSYVYVSDLNLYHIGNPTVEAWIKVQDSTSRAIILSENTRGGGYDGRGYFLDLVNNKLRFGVGNRSGSWNTVTGSTTLQQNTWYHVAGTFDGNTSTVYVNGQSNGSNYVGQIAISYTPLGWLGPNPSTLYFGVQHNTNNTAQNDTTNLEYPFKGIIDGVRIYKKALGSSVILGHYNTPLAKAGDTTKVFAASLGSAIPKEFELTQNYPNPFNPTTDVKYQLPLESSIKLVVYNLLGQQVKVLAEATQSAGFYNVTWDAKDDNGVPVATGFYVYRLNATPVNAERREPFVSIKKMLLLR